MTDWYDFYNPDIGDVRGDYYFPQQEPYPYDFTGSIYEEPYPYDFTGSTYEAWKPSIPSPAVEGRKPLPPPANNIDWNKILQTAGSIGLGAIGNVLSQPKTTPQTTYSLRDPALASQLQSYLSPTISKLLESYSQAAPSTAQTTQWNQEMQGMQRESANRDLLSRNLLGLITTPPALSPYTQQSVELARKLAEPDPEEIRRILQGVTPSTRGMTDIDEAIQNYITKSKGEAANVLSAAGKQEETLKSNWMNQINSLYQSYSQLIGPEAAASRLSLAGYPESLIRSIQGEYLTQTQPLMTLLGQLYSAGPGGVAGISGTSQSGILQVLGQALQGASKAVTPEVETSEDEQKKTLLSSLLSILKLA